ncbi:MAG TPA: SGNH/GDSL hydrolase family protein [Ornithinicoccus sp.]|nr:SGNH/GDSL hydrolase family protein [Ornithinicoccus sp.]
MALISRTTLSAAAAAVGLALPVALIGSAVAAPPTVTYDAIGDSYAAGTGALSGEAYPQVLDGRMQIVLDDFAAVPGADTLDLMEQLADLDEHTDLVTLTIGGNDIPWGATVTQCLLAGDSTCMAAIDAVEAQIVTELPAKLDAAYAAVSEAAPNAHVVVAGYAHLFSPEFGDYTVPGLPALMSVDEQEAANAAADLLNATIAEAVAEHENFQFVDVTKRFDGHGANADDPWLHGLQLDNLGISFHPNADGYRAYASTLTSSINPRDLRG